MTNRHSTKHALLTSLMALLLCFTMLLGTTYAWFTDSVTSEGNKIQAGTLDVELYMWPTANEADKVAISTLDTPIFGPGSLAQDNAAETLWEPGKTQVVYFSIKNNGTLALKYKVDLVVTDIQKNLNEALVYTITPDATFGSIDANNWDDAGVKQVVSGINTQTDTDVELAPQAEHYFALAVHMKEEAGNEYQDGSITFDMMVFASQLSFEEDSFDKTYDSLATFPKNSYGEANVPAGQNTELYIEVRDTEPQQYLTAKAYVPTSALVAGAETVSATVVVAPEVYANVVVESDQGAKTFDISVSNLKDEADITEPVDFALRVGTGLTGVKLFHYDEDVTGKYEARYDGEYLHFKTKGFSPFTVVYDLVAVEPDEDTLDKTVPVAIVTDADEFEADDFNFNWNSALNLLPGDGNDQKLDSVYLFKAPHTSQTVQNNIYKDWYCDYYVKLDSASLSQLPAGSITLGGNYGGWAWVGFDNPSVPVNTFIPLLGSVLGECMNKETGELVATVDTYWTYQNVVGLVEQFWCGVAKANDCTVDLSDATFVVELRLTNPADYSDQIAVNRVTYNFADGSRTIENYPDTMN